MTSEALLNKSNFCGPAGSDHSPSDRAATYRGKAKVQDHQLESLQQGPYHSRLSHFLGG